MAKYTLNINYDIVMSFWDEPSTLDRIKKEVEKFDLQPADFLDIVVNSCGGDVFEAISIKDYLIGLECNKNVIISGICASAATSIVLAFDKFEITSGSMVMFHYSQTGTWGNKAEFLRIYDRLKKVDDGIITNIKEKLVKEVPDLETKLINDWWLSSSEFIEYFGATKAGGSAPAVTNFSKTKFKNILEKYQNAKKTSNSGFSTEKMIEFKNKYKLN